MHTYQQISRELINFTMYSVISGHQRPLPIRSAIVYIPKRSLIYSVSVNIQILNAA